MKAVFILLACLAIALPCMAGSCPDIQESANGAMQSRNSRVSETHNTTMSDPESERESLSECLRNIQALGEGFNLGVSIPGIDQVVSGMCGAVDSFIQQKINDVQNQSLNQINGIGGNNIFKVTGTGGEYIMQLTGKLK